jgi:hypothetical protein
LSKTVTTFLVRLNSRSLFALCHFFDFVFHNGFPFYGEYFTTIVPQFMVYTIKTVKAPNYWVIGL